MLRAYYELAKPGIVYGNLLPAVAAFLYGARFSFSVLTLAALVSGLGLVIASACVFNNFLDRDIDRQMARTKGRALAAGIISSRAALAYGAVLGITGIAILLAGTNVIAASGALVGFVAYVCIYTFAKRATHWGTVIGSVSGSTPIVIGYAAAVNAFDERALLLFLILALWQMPHFYAIALYRLDEYAAAGIPVLPLRRGGRITKQRIAAYIVAFIAACATLTAIDAEGFGFLVVMIVVGCLWLGKALRGFSAADDVAWARSLFLFSLIVLVAFCVALPLGILLP